MTDRTVADAGPSRILMIETFGRGGLLHYAFNLSRALADLGHDVTLLTTVGYELNGEEPPVGLRIERRLARWTQRERLRGGALSGAWKRRFEAIFDAVATALYARRQKPDVVHLHSTNPSALVYLVLLRLMGLRVASTAHVVTPHEPMPFQGFLYGMIHRLPHRVIAHSEVDRERLQVELAVDPRRIAVIPHGEYGFFGSPSSTQESRLEVRRRLNLSPDDEVALFFGYIREYKGLDILFEAWPKVQEAREGARLVVVGNPERLTPKQRSELELQGEALGARCRFEYVPFEEVSQYFTAADLLVMPYRRISQSGVLFLALSLGLPVLATRVGALPEMLEDGVNARLVSPEDPEALAGALVEMLADPDLLGRLAAGGALVAEAHSWPSIAERTATTLADLG